jgi:hypothetical protein
MRAGPKGAVTADPLTLTGWPKVARPVGSGSSANTS